MLAFYFLTKVRLLKKQSSFKTCVKSNHYSCLKSTLVLESLCNCCKLHFACILLNVVNLADHGKQRYVKIRYAKVVYSNSAKL